LHFGNIACRRLGSIGRNRLSTGVLRPTGGRRGVLAFCNMGVPVVRADSAGCKDYAGRAAAGEATCGQETAFSTRQEPGPPSSGRGSSADYSAAFGLPLQLPTARQLMIQPPHGTLHSTPHLAAGLAQREICGNHALSARGGQGKPAKPDFSAGAGPSLLWLRQLATNLFSRFWLRAGGHVKQVEGVLLYARRLG
jgi:hypothetical protein